MAKLINTDKTNKICEIMDGVMQKFELTTSDKLLVLSHLQSAVLHSQHGVWNKDVIGTERRVNYEANLIHKDAIKE